jgi:hypothetical protein
LFLVRREPAHAAQARTGSSGHQFHFGMSLALLSKLAKLNQTRYPFLAREFKAKSLRSASSITKVPKANSFRFRLSFAPSEQTTNSKSCPSISSKVATPA